MSRSKHQFRPGALEVFETRIVPAVVATPLPGLFIPPGQVTGDNGDTGLLTAPHFDIAGNTISTTVTNNTNVTQYVTFVVYTAPGGTDKLSHNFASQKEAYTSETFALASGESHFFSVDLSTLKLVGQQTIQADIFRADNLGGFAPEKPSQADLGGRIVIGDLFNYSTDDKPGSDR